MILREIIAVLYEHAVWANYTTYRYWSRLLYVPCILYSLLSRPTDVQHIY